MSTIEAFCQQIRDGDRRALARAITLVESSRSDHREDAEALLSALASLAQPSIRIGITGAPGVGKSSFIEAFGLYLVERGEKVAVLAVDPSSARSGGSILGDKSRMPHLSQHPRAFIRPSPAGATLGGVARHSRDALVLVEAAGFSVCIVETVGVGQSEFAVADMVDIFVLLLSPAAGDDLQGIKRGVMELADLILVNKADGALLPAAQHTAADYRNALQLIRPKYTDWRAQALLVSAHEGSGLDETWAQIEAFRSAVAEAGSFHTIRRQQAVKWLWSEVNEAMLAHLRADPQLSRRRNELEQQVLTGALLPRIAAQKLIDELMAHTQA